MRYTKANFLKWVEALESGKYRKTERLLRFFKNKRNHYCCLGVLCEINNIPRTKYGYQFKSGEDFARLPFNLIKNFGSAGKMKKILADSNGHVFGYLTDLNDSGKYSFKDIARVIRIQWLGEKLEYPKDLRECI